MAEMCGFCYAPGKILKLGGSHQGHNGLCKDCWSAVLQSSDACPICSSRLTPSELSQVHTFTGKTPQGPPQQAFQGPPPNVRPPSIQPPNFQPPNIQQPQYFGLPSQQPMYSPFVQGGNQYQPMSPQYPGYPPQPGSPMYSPPPYYHSNSSPSQGFQAAYPPQQPLFQGHGYPPQGYYAQPSMPQPGAPQSFVPQSFVQQPVAAQVSPASKPLVRSGGSCFKCHQSGSDDVKMSCGHMACKPHLKEYLTAKTKAGKDVKCPHEGCSVLCTPFFIMMIIEKDDFQEYRRTYLNSIIVVCPNTNCKVIEQIGKKHKIVQCSNCQIEYCSRCEKQKAVCRCEVPQSMTCSKCYLMMTPDRHRMMVCDNCKATMCTYCSRDSSQCTCNHNALTAITRINDVAACEVCGEYMSVNHLENVFAMDECVHVYHKECIEGYVTEKLESGNFSMELGCLKANCMGKVGDFHSLVSEELWSMYERKLIGNRYKMVQCPNTECLQEYSIDGEMKQLQCQNCKRSFCLSCNEPPHEGSCSRNNIQARIRDMEATGDQVSQCPGCKLPYTKDEHCEHVKCMNSDCEVEFCFTCSCMRKPTVAHCNAWHRPNCKWYNGIGADTERFRKDCPECVRLGKLCDPPKALKVPCRFDEGEV